MPRAKLQEVAPEPETVEVVTNTGTPEVQAADTTAPNVKPAFDVYNQSGSLVRTYTIENHGEDAGKLANEYANKIGGSVK